MGERHALKALDVTGEWIWGDDAETTVFAQAYGQSRKLIFRFTSNKTQHSMTTRIVNCYHDLTDNSSDASFPDRTSMRSAVWSAVASVWLECNESPSVTDPDVVIDIYDVESENLSSPTAWSIYHEGLFNDYLNLLLPSDQLSLPQQFDTIDFNDLIRLRLMGGRGSTTLVNTSSNPGSLFVFKGVDFMAFLISYESGYVQEEVKTFYRSIELVSNLPHHPNIMAPPRTVVTIRKPGSDTALVCATLEKFLAAGTLYDQIEICNRIDERIPLSRKSQWCYQMTAAVAHTHLVAHTYHMDIKPGNFLIDNRLNIILIDWEQSDAPVSTAAPEIDGTWDVEKSDDSANSLTYTKYKGPERRNMPTTTPGNNGWNVWNVFPIWHEQCPKAVELAEVFSLGRSLWILLRQKDIDEFEEVKSTGEIVEDWESCEDIPTSWKRIVERCLKRDPNERIGLGELLAFWSDARLQVA